MLTAGNRISDISNEHLIRMWGTSVELCDDVHVLVNHGRIAQLWSMTDNRMGSLFGYKCCVPLLWLMCPLYPQVHPTELTLSDIEAPWILFFVLLPLFGSPEQTPTS